MRLLMLTLAVLAVVGCSKGKSGPKQDLAGLWLSEKDQEKYTIGNSDSPEKICALEHINFYTISRIHKFNSSGGYEQCFYTYGKLACYPDDEFHPSNKPAPKRECAVAVSLRNDGKLNAQYNCPSQPVINGYVEPHIRVTEEGLFNMFAALQNCDFKKSERK